MKINKIYKFEDLNEEVQDKIFNEFYSETLEDLINGGIIEEIEYKVSGSRSYSNSIDIYEIVYNGGDVYSMLKDRKLDSETIENIEDIIYSNIHSIESACWEILFESYQEYDKLGNVL